METGITRPIAIILGVTIVAAFGFLAIWGFAPTDGTQAPEGLREIQEPAQLADSVEMSHLGILTSTNFLGHRVYTVQANLKNISDAPLRFIEVRMTFLDAEKQVLMQERRPVLQPSSNPLEPGTEYRFEVAFENPPKDWNYHVPETTVVKIAY